jgi:hypothetical protein
VKYQVYLALIAGSASTYKLNQLANIGVRFTDEAYA